VTIVKRFQGLPRERLKWLTSMVKKKTRNSESGRRWPGQERIHSANSPPTLLQYINDIFRPRVAQLAMIHRPILHHNTARRRHLATAALASPSCSALAPCYWRAPCCLCVPVQAAS